MWIQRMVQKTHLRIYEVAFILRQVLDDIVWQPCGALQTNLHRGKFFLNQNSTEGGGGGEGRTQQSMGKPVLLEMYTCTAFPPAIWNTFPHQMHMEGYSGRTFQ